MFLSSISIKRPIMISMILIAFFIFGLLGYFSLPLNLVPDVEFGFVTIQTVYPGAGPKEIEAQVTKKIEDAVSTISKINYVQSYSMEGVSYVIMRFELDKDPDIANQEAKDKVNAILSDLPDDAEIPIVQKFDIGAFPIVEIVMTGNMSRTELYELADKKLRDRLSQVDGVARVEISGGQEREIRVELDNRVVYQNSISLQKLSQILAVQNMNMPGGQFKQGGQEFSVRLQGEFDRVQTIKDLEIPTAYGNKKISQLAEVYDAGTEVRERTTFFNNVQKKLQDNVVLLSVIKSSEGNTVDIAKDIAAQLPDLEAELPTGTRLSIVRDASIFIESSVEDTLGNIILGIVFTGLVLLFFLHDLRSTIIVGTAMPFSIISTFLFLQISDFSLNMMTLMGLSTAVGILVANSVVVLENIFRHKDMGHKRKEASDIGTSEIAVAVIASTLTNLVVFLPIAAMTSMVGQFFKEFALTVSYATIFSLIASFTITPMLASLILPEKDTKKHPIGQKLEAMFKSWENRYKILLKKMLENKKRSLIVIVISILMFVLSLFVAGNIGFEFMPMMDEGNVNIEVELPQGYNLDQTADVVNEIQSRLEKHKEIRHIVTTLGSLSDLDKGTNMAIIKIKMVDASERDISSVEATNIFIKELSDIPNARIRVGAVSPFGGGDAPLQFYVQGQDMDQLEQYKNEIYEKIKEIPGLVNLNTSSRPGKPEITLIPDRQKVVDAGITVMDLAMTLRSAVEGIVATQYRESGNEYDIRVVMNDESVNTPEEIGNITVVTPKGLNRMSQFADVRFTEGYNRILHRDKYISILFSAYTAPGYALGDLQSAINKVIDGINFAPGYQVKWGGDAEQLQESIVDMLRTFIIALLLTYMLLAAILENFVQPLMILGTVPLALIGVFLAMFITGKTMNIISMMAIVMLLGIVVNNAILILDYTNILRKRGMSVHDALVEASPTKLKPVIMATVAIILGMMPMAMGIGSSGVEFRQPMGIVSIGGLIISTVLTLFVIPAIYYLISKSKPVESK